MKRLTHVDLREALTPYLPEAQPFIEDLEKTQVFDFGVLSDEYTEHINTEMTAELWHRRLLRLPFDRTIFTFIRSAVRLYLVIVDDMVIKYPGEQDEVATSFAVVGQSVVTGRAMADAVCWFNTPTTTDVKAGARALCEISEETDQSFREFTLGCCASVMRLCMALNTKGVQQRHEPVPVKLNQKRAKSNKPPLPAITYVNLSNYCVPRSGATGTGSPKAMHLRRGHIRRYDDGSVTWVRDTIVKADGDLKQRERYQVRRPQ